MKDYTNFKEEGKRFIENYVIKRGSGRVDEAERRYEIMKMVYQIANELKNVSTIGEVSYYTSLMSLIISAELTDDVKVYGMIQTLLNKK